MSQTNKCKYLYDKVCCNDSSAFLADFPSQQDCDDCPLKDVKDKNNDKRRIFN